MGVACSFHRAATVADRDVAEEIVLVDLVSGEAFGVTGAGALIWTALEQPAPLDELVDLVVARYQVPKERARDDVSALLETLVAKGLAVRVE